MFRGNAVKASKGKHSHDQTDEEHNKDAGPCSHLVGNFRKGVLRGLMMWELASS